LVRALDALDATFVITLPNADPDASGIRDLLVTASLRPRRVAVEALGERGYWGLMRVADAILGNSSSALIEAPLIPLPAVNVGHRQEGRLRGSNVLDVAPDADEIVRALAHALDPSFRRGLPRGGPYGDGHAAPQILAVLASWRPPHPPVKSWTTMP
jgi:UDP-N-acetylglucosamine 2-epimerase